MKFQHSARKWVLSALFKIILYETLALIGLTERILLSHFLSSTKQATGLKFKVSIVILQVFYTQVNNDCFATFYLITSQ
jgi:hypothetical protein